MTAWGGRRLRIAALTQPARFPTVVHDPGRWWPAALLAGHELVRLDLNAAWWRWVCSADGYRALCGGSSFHAWLPSPGERDAAAAGVALRQLADAATYETAERYVATLAPLERYLDLLAGESPDISVQWAAGPVVRHADYADSRSLLHHATRRGVFGRSIDEVLPPELPMLDLVVVSVTAPEDLLSAMAVVHRLRQRQPQLHACLADHGFENFSLRPHVDTLRKTGALTNAFDSIVVGRDDRDSVVSGLAEALTAGDSPSGWLTAADVPVRSVEPPESIRRFPPAALVPPPSESFSPEPILLTRVSQRRCYWSRCTFCIHNAKYDNPAPPSLSEVESAVDRVAAQLDAGYRHLIFLDEALSPALLTRLAEQLTARGLPDRGLRWAGRSKLEHAHDSELFQAVRRAGAVELLFGIESTSERTLRRMDKHTDGLTAERVLDVLTSAADAGLGLHVNMIAGFPGDGPRDLEASLAFVERVGRLPNVTFTVNPFVVFPATPVHDNPRRFNVALDRERGDMQAIRGYRVTGADAAPWRESMERLPRLVQQLRETLGWSRYDMMPGGRLAMDLYFGTGHSTWLKAMPGNPLIQGKPTHREVVMA